jgi:hypothetical protein
MAPVTVSGGADVVSVTMSLFSRSGGGSSLAHGQRRVIVLSGDIGVLLSVDNTVNPLGPRPGVQPVVHPAGSV